LGEITYRARMDSSDGMSGQTENKTDKSSSSPTLPSGVMDLSFNFPPLPADSLSNEIENLNNEKQSEQDKKDKKAEKERSRKTKKKKSKQSKRKSESCFRSSTTHTDSTPEDDRTVDQNKRELPGGLRSTIQIHKEKKNTSLRIPRPSKSKLTNSRLSTNDASPSTSSRTEVTKGERKVREVPIGLENLHVPKKKEEAEKHLESQLMASRPVATPTFRGIRKLTAFLASSTARQAEINLQTEEQHSQTKENIPVRNDAHCYYAERMGEEESFEHMIQSEDSPNSLPNSKSSTVPSELQAIDSDNLLTSKDQDEKAEEGLEPQLISSTSPATSKFRRVRRLSALFQLSIARPSNIDSQSAGQSLKTEEQSATVEKDAIGVPKEEEQTSEHKEQEDESTNQRPDSMSSLVSLKLQEKTTRRSLYGSQTSVGRASWNPSATRRVLAFVSIGSERITETAAEEETKEVTEKEADAATNTKATDVAGQSADSFTQNVTVQVVPQYTHIPLVSQEIMTLYQAVMTPSVHDIDSTVVALVSHFPSSMHEFLPEESRVLLVFRSLGIHPIYVNGSDPKETLRRNELFGISGKWGTYPQLFVRKKDTGKLEFFADVDQIEALNDCSVLRETLDTVLN